MKVFLIGTLLTTFEVPNVVRKREVVTPQPIQNQ